MIGRKEFWGPVLFLALTVGCAKVPPVPVDRFYRLPRAATQSIQHPPGNGPRAGWLGTVVSVPPFRADGIHKERALVYTDDAQAIALKRYHYHFWVDSPTRLLQEELAERLRAAGAGRMVLTGRDAVPDVTVSGRIKEFEHHLRADRASSTRVGLEIEVRRHGERNPRWIRSYHARATVTDPTMLGAVAAFGRALDRVIAEIIADLRSLPTQ